MDAARTHGGPLSPADQLKALRKITRAAQMARSNPGTGPAFMGYPDFAVVRHKGIRFSDNHAGTGNEMDKETMRHTQTYVGTAHETEKIAR